MNFAASSGARQPYLPRHHNTYYSLARLDFLATQKIRLFGSWHIPNAPDAELGGLALPKADDAFGQFNANSTNSPDNYNGGIGSVSPNVIYNTGADITITPNMVATTRFGYFYRTCRIAVCRSAIRYVYRGHELLLQHRRTHRHSRGPRRLDGTPSCPPNS